MERNNQPLPISSPYYSAYPLPFRHTPFACHGYALLAELMIVPELLFWGSGSQGMVCLSLAK